MSGENNLVNFGPLTKKKTLTYDLEIQYGSCDCQGTCSCKISSSWVQWLMSYLADREKTPTKTIQSVTTERTVTDWLVYSDATNVHPHWLEIRIKHHSNTEIQVVVAILCSVLFYSRYKFIHISVMKLMLCCKEWNKLPESGRRHATCRLESQEDWVHEFHLMSACLQTTESWLDWNKMHHK